MLEMVLETQFAHKQSRRMCG